MLAMQTGVARNLVERLLEARRRSDSLFRLVREDSLYERPIPERHRIIFYIGHLEAFDWNLLRDCVVGKKSAHSEFDQLFAFGIDPVGGGLPNDQLSDWPSLEFVRNYVAQTRSSLDEGLADQMLESHVQACDGFSLGTLLNVAIEHRLMHVETLAYMLHQLPLDRKLRQVDPPGPVSPPVEPRMVVIPAGTATLGLSRDSKRFGWDNEFEAHTRHVTAFEIDRYRVTNRQYLDFMTAGGYDTRDFWSNDSWTWKTARGISHPVFWKKTNGKWLYRTMFDEIPLPLDWPVYVSHAEATAYASWAGKSLPTEEDWHRAAIGAQGKTEEGYAWGDDVAHASWGNYDFNRWDPVAVNAFPRNESSFGVHGMLGNGWEWTSTVFAPFPGFEPFPFYRGYSADFFDSKHFVMKGASTRTAACMLRPTFRNWFQAHYQYVYSGFRCVNH